MNNKSSFPKALVSSLLILGLLSVSSCKKADEKKKESDFVTNSVPKKVSVDEIPYGYEPYSVEKWDLSFCYPAGSEIDFNKKTGVSIKLDPEETEDEIRILRIEEDAKAPEEFFEDLEGDLKDEFSKLKGSDVEETKVNKRVLYYQAYSSKDGDVDAYIEIYEEFTLAYLAICESSGDLDGKLNTIMKTLAFDPDAYEDVEVADPDPTQGGNSGKSSGTTVIEDTFMNVRLTVPADNMTQQDCPVGVYATYPGAAVGALYMNSDPIGSCVYDAEDLLASFLLYDGMIDSMILQDNVTIGNYYDSSYNGIPEIDAEFSYVTNGQAGEGYCRFINGPTIGCYMVLYTIDMVDSMSQEEHDSYVNAIETFETIGNPNVTQFDVQQTDFGLRYVVRGGTYSDVVNESSSGCTYVFGLDDSKYIEIGEENASLGGVDDCISYIQSIFEGLDNYQYTISDYTSSRFVSKIIRLSYDRDGETYYIAYAAITMGNNVTYFCDYVSTDPDTSVQETFMDDFLWSVNIKT